MYFTLLTHVKVSVRYLFKGWPIQSFSVVITHYFLYFSFHIQKQLISRARAINLQVLTEMRLGILHMPNQIVGQVGKKTKTSITGGKESTLSIKMEGPVL